MKAIQFLLASNIGEIIVIFIAIMFTPMIASAAGISDISELVPLLPIHILWINLVTDSLPALALAVEPANKDLMKRKPIKPSKGIFTKGLTFRVAYQGVMIGIITLIAFLIGINTPNIGEHERIAVGQTMAFATLAFAELVHVFNVKSNKESIFKVGILNNTKLLLAIGVSALMMFTILLIPALRDIFNIVALPVENILEVILLVLSPLVIVEIFKLLKINTAKDEE